MLNQKIIEFLKTSKSKNFQHINRAPFMVYPPIKALKPVYELEDNYVNENEHHGARSIPYGEQFGSPNTKMALQWYKTHVGREQYLNSQYYAKVLKRIPGKQTLYGDWHNHDTAAIRKSYLISSNDPTLVLKLPSLQLPALPRRAANENFYFPVVNKLIQKEIITEKEIFRPKRFEAVEIDKSFVHKSAVIPFDEDVSKEPYRWFIYISY